VIHGQLPTKAFPPVKRLKNVDLPVFGIPNKAIRLQVLLLFTAVPF
jgi:hypothetical protein